MGSHQIAAYATNAVLGDMFAIISADIVLQRTKDEEVAAMARRLRAEHSAARTSLEALVRSEVPGLVLPNTLDRRRQGLVDNLQKASSASFDRVYLDQQIAAQEEAITLHRGFANHDASRGLAIHALTVLTGVEDDLTQLRRLRRAIKR
jgi:putative membrane protein